MFCTNCGEEMRDTDKFCAECGTPAAPRGSKKRDQAAAEPQTPPPTPPAQFRSRSTAEAFFSPQASNISNVGATSPMPGSAWGDWNQQPASPAVEEQSGSAATAGIAPATEEEAQRSLIQAEEIASVRDMAPIDALPDDLPPGKVSGAPPRIGGSVTATLQCPRCGKLSGGFNQFCEACGTSLEIAGSHSAATRTTPSSGWLYESESEPAPAEPASAATTQAAFRGSGAAVQTAPTTDDNFSYYYDDSAAHSGSRAMLIGLLVVLVLGIIGVFYLMLRPSGKTAAAGNVSVTISPAEAQVAVGGAYDFAATVSGSGNSDVLWSVQEGGSGGKVVNRGAQAQGGTVATVGVYVAPNNPGRYHVIASSKTDPSKSATAEVTVTPR